MAIGKQSIWRLVQSCAEQLTASGNSPFTRADLIKCVGKNCPAYGENSINPIIQGVTDNLRGGAPGAVGKDILHSVGRGLFILKAGTTSKPKHIKPKDRQRAEQAGKLALPRNDNSEHLKIGEYRFHKICDIRPVQNGSGAVSEFLPQEQYINEQNLALNKYGVGPFCKFKIPNNHHTSGVYAIVVDGNIKYIGECQNLSSRYNMGYGNISPRNCFIGGQETNCRINNLILNATKSGALISLWFMESEDYKKVEMELRS